MLVMLFVSLWTLIEGDAMATAEGAGTPSISLSGEGNQRLDNRHISTIEFNERQEEETHGMGITANLPLYSLSKTCRSNSTHSHAVGLQWSPPWTQKRSVP